MANKKWKNVSNRGKRPGKAGLQERREPSRRQREPLDLDQGGKVWGSHRVHRRGQTKERKAECGLRMIDSCGVIWDLESRWIM